MERAHGATDPRQDGVAGPDGTESFGSAARKYRTAEELPEIAITPGTTLGRLLLEADLQLVDIGARGSTRRELKVLAPFASLFACEPEAQEAERLRASLAAELPWRDVTVIPAAIAGSAGEAPLYVTAQPGMSSLLPTNERIVARYYKEDAFAVVDTQRVTTISLDEAADRYGFHDACFLKLDTQGTELEILRSGMRLVDRTVVGVAVESLFHEFYVGQSLFADVDAHLRASGFALVELQPTAMRGRNFQPDLVSRRQPVWAHCLYLRQPEDVLDRGSTTVARWLAIALAYQQFDLVLSTATGTNGDLLRASFGNTLAEDIAAHARLVTEHTLTGMSRSRIRATLAPSGRA